MTTSELLHPLRRAPAPVGRPASPRRSPISPSSRTADRSADPSWARPALIALLLLTAVAYIWDLSASGYANSFYAAAVQAGTKSWKAFFFGSIDSSNFITVDKPPASLWVMSLSGRIFGFSSASMLIPQALEGVAAVGLLYAAIKRWFGAGAGLTAGAIFALTPVAALMFRYNNPDALLVLMLVAGAYCMVRAIEHAGTRWILAAGTMIGFAFLAKMMQAFLVLPAFALVYLVAAPTPLRRRAWQMLAGGAAVILSAGWWVAIVALWPAASRPMIDGSSDNSILNLIVGYNGLGRIFGSSSGGNGASFSGETGALRLFNEAMGGQSSWLLPVALLALLGGLVVRRRAPRTDRTRAALLLWGGWLIVTAVVFSFSKGVIHTYYTVALAPAIAALVAIGARMCWARRESLVARMVAILAIAASAGWAYALLARTPSWEPWLRPLILATAALGVLGLALGHALGNAGRRLSLAAAVLGVVAVMAGPLAYSADTITTTHNGSIPAAGPAGTTGGGFGGHGGSASPSAGGKPGAPPSGSPSIKGVGAASTANAASSRSHFAGPTGGGGGGGGTETTTKALVKALQSNAASYRWVAATSGSQSAATLELATNEPVMAIGGFSNEGGKLSLAAFEQYVAKGEIHYYIASSGGAGGGPGGGADATSAITTWVKAHYTAQTIGGQAVYELTKASS